MNYKTIRLLFRAVILFSLLFGCTKEKTPENKDIPAETPKGYCRVIFDSTEIGSEWYLIMDDKQEACMLTAGAFSSAVFEFDLFNKNGSEHEVEYQTYIDKPDYKGSEATWPHPPAAEGKFRLSPDKENPYEIIFRTIKKGGKIIVEVDYKEGN